MPLLAAARDRTIEIEINSDGGNAYLVLALFEDLVMHPRQVMATLSCQQRRGDSSDGCRSPAHRSWRASAVHKVRTTARDVTADGFRAELAGDRGDRWPLRDILADATGRPLHQVDAWLTAETIHCSRGLRRRTRVAIW